MQSTRGCNSGHSSTRSNFTHSSACRDATVISPRPNGSGSRKTRASQKNNLARKIRKHPVSTAGLSGVTTMVRLRG
jgi:hypothetical protein